jgi:8-oxo-dGTP diphosphatase
VSDAVIQVVAAVIEHEGRFLLCQRHDGPHLPLKWEFPGGKIEPGETPEAALHR